MAVMPGGPHGPTTLMNVTGVGNSLVALSMDGNENPYGDSGLANDARMGADVLNPAMVPHSPVMNQHSNGTRS